MTEIEAQALITENQQLRSQVSSLTQRNAEIQAQLTWFTKQLFGAKSERRIIEPANVKQLCLGESFESQETSVEAAAETVKSYARRKSSKPEIAEGSAESLLRFDPSVPVEEVIVPNPKLDELGPEQYEIIGKEESYKLGQKPSSFVVVKYIRHTVKYKDTGKITTTPMPPMVVDRSFSDVSFIAGSLVDKFVYHIPFNRQWERLKADGITVSRATLPTQGIRAIELLSPVYDAQERSVVSSSVLAMDDTWMKVGVSSPGKMHKGHFWPLYGDKDEVVFPYRESRRDEEVEGILGDNFKGVLLADGHAAYDKYAAKRAKTVTRAQCWVHTRRNFFECIGPPELRDKALDIIGRMYEQEERIRRKQLVDSAKLAFRGEFVRPLVEEFFEWLRKVCLDRAFLPTDPFMKAAAYALKREEELKVFLSHPEVPMDTNHNERALRVIPMGRRNYLFCWTELGAECVGKIQSLLVTCKLHEIDPYVYLVDVLQRIQTHPIGRVEELTPRIWKEKFASDPMISPLEMAIRQRELRTLITSSAQ